MRVLLTMIVLLFPTFAYAENENRCGTVWCPEIVLADTWKNMARSMEPQGRDGKSAGKDNNDRDSGDRGDDKGDDRGDKDRGGYGKDKGC